MPKALLDFLSSGLMKMQNRHIFMYVKENKALMLQSFGLLGTVSN